MCGNSQATIRAVRAGRGRCEERVCDEGLGRPSGCGAATHRTNVRRPGGGRQWQAGSVAGRTFTGSLTTHVGASVGAWACSACLRAEAVQMCVPRREPGGAGEVCSGRNSWAVVRAAGCAAGAQQARAVPCGQEAAHAELPGTSPTFRNALKFTGRFEIQVSAKRSLKSAESLWQCAASCPHGTARACCAPAAQPAARTTAKQTLAPGAHSPRQLARAPFAART